MPQKEELSKISLLSINGSLTSLQVLKKTPGRPLMAKEILDFLYSHTSFWSCYRDRRPSGGQKNIQRSSKLPFKCLLEMESQNFSSSSMDARPSQGLQQDGDFLKAFFYKQNTYLRYFRARKLSIGRNTIMRCSRDSFKSPSRDLLKPEDYPGQNTSGRRSSFIIFQLQNSILRLSEARKTSRTLLWAKVFLKAFWSQQSFQLSEPENLMTLQRQKTFTHHLKQEHFLVTE